MANALKVNNLSTEKPNTGLTEEQRAGVTEALNTLLADELVLYVKTRKFHWNIKGPRFHDLHVFFEKQYEELDELMDEVAESARQFGGNALGTLKEAIGRTRLKEAPESIPNEDGMLKELLEDHENIMRHLREDIRKATDELQADDAADFMTAVLEAHGKMAWMLRAHLPS